MSSRLSGYSSNTLGGLNPASGPLTDQAQQVEGGDDNAIAAFFNEAMTRIADPTELTSGDGRDLDAVRALAVSRRFSFDTEQSPQPATGYETKGHELVGKLNKLRQSEAIERKIMSISRNRAAVRQFMQKYPELADETGINEAWDEKIVDMAAKVGKKSFRALDIILRNLDRGRGAIAAYTLAVSDGGTTADARGKAYAALKGSSAGWRWVPTEMGPGFKEVLQASGMDDSISTSLLGFAGDVIVDPINLLGIGFSRKGLEIGAHQVLNRAGRQRYGTLVREEMEGITERLGKDAFDLEVDELREVNGLAAKRMRQLINSDKNLAYEYLDIGGLKIAGHTLPGTAYIRRKETMREGYQFDYVSEGLAKMLGRGSMEGVDTLGRKLLAQDPGWLGQNLGKFMKWLPESLEAAGERVGFIMNRTNPAAGKEYKWFKQAEYYDKMGYAHAKVQDDVRQMFEGVHNTDLNDLAMVLEEMKDNPEAIQEFLGKIGQREGMMYVQTVEEGIMKYRQQMDEIVIDEVNRGFFRKKGGVDWTADEKEVFSDWVRSGADPNAQLPKKLLNKFETTRNRHYIPHVYRNQFKLKKLYPHQLKEEPPRIVEPFTHRRVVDSLREAQERGLVPETNLAVLAGIRMAAHARAVVTHDFLEGTARQFGTNLSHLMKKGKEAIELAGKPLPDPWWRKVLLARTTSEGKIAWGVQEQREAARAMAREYGVTPEAVAKLDEAAITEFLSQRLRTISPARAKAFWRKYVEEPTQKRLYNGHALVDGDNYNDAMARSRELFDKNYPQWSQVDVGGLADPKTLKRVMFPTPIANDIARLKGTKIIPPEFKQLLRGYDLVNYWWKRNMTILFPAFHVRNKITNILNSMTDIGIAGVLDRETMFGVTNGAAGTLTTELGAKYSYSQVRKMARRLGVYRSVYKRHDIAEMIHDVIKHDFKEGAQIARRFGIDLPGRKELMKKGELVGPQSISNPLIAPWQAGSDVGMYIENGDRMQLFVKSLQRGMSPDQAARRVNEFLFDYDDISSFERDIVRRFFNPFWTWTRKNIALQSRTLVKYPGRFTPPSKFARAMSSEDDDALRSDLERNLLPQYWNDIYSIRKHSDGVKLSKWLTRFDAPQGDLNRLYQGNMRETFQDWMAGISPFLREILEGGLNQDMWSGRKEIDLQRGEKVYDFVWSFHNTPLKNLLKMRKVPGVDGVDTIRVDAGRWKTLMWMTAWQGTRLYTTVGKFADPAQGSMLERAFHFLTGMKYEYVRPAEQVRRMGESAAFDSEGGLDTSYRNGWKRAKLRLIEEMGIERANDVMGELMDAEIETPIDAIDLDAGTSWEEQEGV